MLRRKALIAAVGGTLAVAATAFAPAAHADRVAFNLSFGGPGYGVSVGNAPYYYGHHRYHGHWRAPYAPVYVAPPVVYSAPVVVAPTYGYAYPYSYRYPYAGRVYYRY